MFVYATEGKLALLFEKILLCNINPVSYLYKQNNNSITSLTKSKVLRHKNN